MSTAILEHKELSSPSPIKTGEYKKTSKLFFVHSKLLEAQITDLFDDVWPTVTAWKNLRWHVKGYHFEHPNYDNNQLIHRFVDTNDKSNRPNLYRRCIQEPWEDQKYRIAANLLLNTFACFEGWVDELLNALGVYSRTRASNFQFPYKWSNELANMQSGGNQVIVDAFYDAYKSSNKRYNSGHLNNYYKAYRFFKECRNSIVHSGGIASTKLISAQTDYQALSKADLDVKEIPEYHAAQHGKPISISLRGVVGFTQIILNIVSTLDIEFIKCKNADSYFINYLKSALGGGYPVTASTNPKKLQKDIIHICGKASFKPPREFANLHSFLSSNRIML